SMSNTVDTSECSRPSARMRASASRSFDCAPRVATTPMTASGAVSLVMADGSWHIAEGGQTKPDFLAKLSVSRKESWETIYWLQLGIASSVMSKEEVAWPSAISHDHLMEHPQTRRAVGRSPASPGR